MTTADRAGRRMALATFGIALPYAVLLWCTHLEIVAHHSEVLIVAANLAYLWFAALLLRAVSRRTWDLEPQLVVLLRKAVGCVSGRRALLVTAGLATAYLLLAWSVTLRFPNSGDEYAYVFQAETFAAGRTWTPAPPAADADAYGMWHVFIKDGRWVSRFPPGWPAVLALGRLIGLPEWSVAPLLGALTWWVFLRFARRVEGARAAALAALVLGVTAFFALNAASFFSHVAAALALVTFTGFGVRTLDAGRRRDALAAGLALGFLAVTRYYTAAVCVLPFVVAALRRPGRTTWSRLSWVAVGALPFVAALAIYNASVTGSWHTLVTSWGDPDEGIGFVKGHNPWWVLTHIAHHVIFLFPYTAPLLFFVYLAALARARARGALRFYDAYYLLLLIAHAFYYTTGGNQYGPRFLFEAFPFLLLRVAAEVVDIVDGGTAADTRRGLDRQMLIAGATCVWGVLLGLAPACADVRAMTRERMDLYRAVEQAGVENAVVVVGSSTGIIKPFDPRELVRNGPWLRPDAAVIYVRDIEGVTEGLRTTYPGRTFLEYVRETDDAEGRIIPYEPAARGGED